MYYSKSLIMLVFLRTSEFPDKWCSMGNL